MGENKREGGWEGEGSERIRRRGDIEELDENQLVRRRDVSANQRGQR